MEQLIEEIIIYGVVFLMCVAAVYFYLKAQKKTSDKTEAKVKLAKEEGLFEPVSLHPFINLDTCIGSGACITACPEKDILGLVKGKATVINASNCVGHGACFHACPVEAISLRIGTEKRGVDLPHVNENFETNVEGIFIAGELGGMGLIKNSVEQGQQAVQSMIHRKTKKIVGVFDLVVVGAGPAGISASLEAKKHAMNTVTLEQDSLGGTVYSFPREKIVMTAPMDLPLHGKVKLFETSKDELIGLWTKVITENNLDIREHKKAQDIIMREDGIFKIIAEDGDEFLTHHILLAIGRRGTPRKLGVPGEEKEKVFYRLLEPDRYNNRNITVVGGGDSAIESAMLLMDNNRVTLSYRKDKFARLKPKNRAKILKAIEENKLQIKYNTNVTEIEAERIELTDTIDGSKEWLDNDLVYIFAGGVLPTKFLQNAGIEIAKRFGYIVKKHK